MTFEQLPIFVYGTLQRGEVRGKMWPCRPLSVQWATIRATLYDLGPYPAMLPGQNLVLGELWTITERDLPATVCTLDAIEGFAGRPDDLYTRQVVTCTTLSGHARRAYAYFYAKPDVIDTAAELDAGPNGLVHWRRQTGDENRPPELKPR